MVFTEKQISDLRVMVRARLSDKRFSHTLGVERASAAICEKIFPERVSEARVSALLHDITKEYSDEKNLQIMKDSGLALSDSDLMSSPIYHSLSGPLVIKNEFPEYYTDDIASAVLYHTTADPNMSVFDEILFVADYVEEGRTYPLCVQLRKSLFSRLSCARNSEECISNLHDATIRALENTILALVERGSFLHEKTVMARNAFLARRPMPLN